MFETIKKSEQKVDFCNLVKIFTLNSGRNYLVSCLTQKLIYETNFRYHK